MRLFLLCCFCLCCCSPGYAQFSDSVQHLVAFSGTGSLNRTNDGTNYLLNNSLRYSLRRKDARLNESNTWIYGANPTKLTNNDFTATLDFNLYKTFKHFYYWGLGNYTTSYSLRIDNQVQGGLGAAYNIVDREDATVNLSDGFLYERSNIFLNDTVREEYHTFRNSFRLQFRWKYKNLLTLNGFGFYQPSLQDADDYIIRSSITLGVRIFRFVSLTTAFTYNMLSRTKRETLLFTYGLTIERYF